MAICTWTTSFLWCLRRRAWWRARWLRTPSARLWMSRQQQEWPTPSGAEIFLDAVHYGPHGLIDVQAFDCDYLVCSGYKIFGPHMGFLWGRRELLERLPTFREDFIPNEPPGKIEAGTFVYENVAGMEAAVRLPGNAGPKHWPVMMRRRNRDRRGPLCDVRSRQSGPTKNRFRSKCSECSAIAAPSVYGVTEKERMNQRVPTLCFNLPNVLPARVSEELAKENIGARDGHMYTPRLMKRLGLPVETGAVRASLVHYNTVEEVRRFGRVLSEITKSC